MKNRLASPSDPIKENQLEDSKDILLEEPDFGGSQSKYSKEMNQISEKKTEKVFKNIDIKEVSEEQEQSHRDGKKNRLVLSKKNLGSYHSTENLKIDGEESKMYLNRSSDDILMENPPITGTLIKKEDIPEKTESVQGTNRKLYNSLVSNPNTKNISLNDEMAAEDWKNSNSLELSNSLPKIDGHKKNKKLESVKVQQTRKEKLIQIHDLDGEIEFDL